MYKLIKSIENKLIYEHIYECETLKHISSKCMMFGREQL